MDRTKIIQKISGFSDRYMNLNEMQDQIADKNKVLNMWEEAMKFFFKKSFYRGRRDELSRKYMNLAFDVLSECKLSENYDKLVLDEKLKSKGVNNEMDRKMVIETIDLVFTLPQKYKNNIVQFSISEIKKNKINDVYKSLDSIHGVGDKIASFYLRDVILIYQLENYLSNYDYKYCQPIDTWIRKLGQGLGISSKRTSDSDLKTTIIEECKKAKVSPVSFNAGAWIFAAKSFDILIDEISNIV